MKIDYRMTAILQALTLATERQCAKLLCDREIDLYPYRSSYAEYSVMMKDGRYYQLIYDDFAVIELDALRFNIEMIAAIMVNAIKYHKEYRKDNMKGYG